MMTKLTITIDAKLQPDIPIEPLIEQIRSALTTGTLAFNLETHIQRTERMGTMEDNDDATPK